MILAGVSVISLFQCFDPGDWMTTGHACKTCAIFLKGYLSKKDGRTKIQWATVFQQCITKYDHAKHCNCHTGRRTGSKILGFNHLDFHNHATVWLQQKPTGRINERLHVINSAIHIRPQYLVSCQHMAILFRSKNTLTGQRSRTIHKQ